MRLEKRRIQAFCFHCRLPIAGDHMATEAYRGECRTFHPKCIVEWMNSSAAAQKDGAYHAAPPVRFGERKEV